MATIQDHLKTLQKDFIIYAGHTLSLLYLHKYKEVGREKYFIFHTKKNYLKISNQEKARKWVCACVCESVSSKLLKCPR